MPAHCTRDAPAVLNIRTEQKVSLMYLEIARLRPRPDGRDALLDVYRVAKEVPMSYGGVDNMSLFDAEGESGELVLLFEWTSKLAHDEFRASPEFENWRGPLLTVTDGLPAVSFYHPVSI
jgi:quinol monooxygenase YgiN